MRLVPLLALATLTCCPSFALAHSGGLDANGCHTDHKTGDYHCHKEPASGKAPAEAGPPVKKSSTGICHDRKSQYYASTKNFTAFQTMKACLDSGGRRPK